MQNGVSAKNTYLCVPNPGSPSRNRCKAYAPSQPEKAAGERANDRNDPALVRPFVGASPDRSDKTHPKSCAIPFTHPLEFIIITNGWKTRKVVPRGGLVFQIRPPAVKRSALQEFFLRHEPDIGQRHAKQYPFDQIPPKAA